MSAQVVILIFTALRNALSKTAQSLSGYWNLKQADIFKITQIIN
jgi:hypothetical protein